MSTISTIASTSLIGCAALITVIITDADMQKKKRKISFWSNIHFKYKISVINENTLEEVAWLRISKLNGLSLFLLTMIILFFIASLIVAFTPLRNYLPGYMDTNARTQIVGNALAVDSLENALVRQQLYMENIKDILRGEVKADTIHSIDSITQLRADSLMARTEREEEFRRRYEEKEKFNITNTNVTLSELGNVMFVSPMSGTVVRPFSLQTDHKGTDLAVKPKSNILATLGGTVIFCGYTAEHGYTVVMQHSMNTTSVYAGCGTILKNEGDIVEAGEAIALTAGTNSGEKDSVIMHFELWHNGKAVNPENFILF